MSKNTKTETSMIGTTLKASRLARIAKQAKGKKTESTTIVETPVQPGNHEPTAMLSILADVAEVRAEAPKANSPEAEAPKAKGNPGAKRRRQFHYLPKTGQAVKPPRATSKRAVLVNAMLAGTHTFEGLMQLTGWNFKDCSEAIRWSCVANGYEIIEGQDGIVRASVPQVEQLVAAANG